jgi:hypothetical protein
MLPWILLGAILVVQLGQQRKTVMALKLQYRTYSM